MDAKVQPFVQQPPQYGQVAGEQEVGTNLKVVDANQLPGPDGKSPNVATGFKLGDNGQGRTSVIQVGSSVVPPPPHDPNNVQGEGAVWWRGFSAGIGHPAAFFSTVGAMRSAALQGQDFTPDDFQRAWTRGSSYDTHLQGAPVLGLGFMIGRGISDVGNPLAGQPTNGGEPPPPPAPIDQGGHGDDSTSVKAPGAS